MIKKMVLVLALAGLLAALAGCNTIRGAGRDIAAVGEAVVESARSDP
ncbi:MAG: entericidin A/B family lipoprotein [Planctomycetota bacterium]|jgi:predicted small secreted protein